MGGLGGDVRLMSNRDIITTEWASPFSVILFHLIYQWSFNPLVPGHTLKYVFLF